MTENRKIIIEPYEPPIYAPCKMCFVVNADDKITNAKIETGYLAKNLEFAAQNFAFPKLAYLLGQADCKFSYSTSLASILLVEKALNIQVSEYAQLVRTIFIEAGRTAYFLRKIAGILDLISAQLFASQARNFANSIENLVLRNIKHKSLLYFWILGGIKSALLPDFAVEIMKLAEQIQARLADIETMILQNPQVKTLLNQLGRLTQDDAVKMSLSGLSLRSTGVNLDARKTTQYLSYPSTNFEICNLSDGDALSRFNLMFNEVNLSFRIIQQLLPKLQDCEILPVIDDKIAGALNIQQADASDYFKSLEFFRDTTKFVNDGDFSQDFEVEEGILRLFMHVNDGQIQKFQITPPSQYNILAFEKACLSHTIEELPMIFNTFDISFGQADK